MRNKARLPLASLALRIMSGPTSLDISSSVSPVPGQIKFHDENDLTYVLLLSEVVTALITVLSQVPSVYSSLRASRELYRSMLLSVIR